MRILKYALVIIISVVLLLAIPLIKRFVDVNRLSFDFQLDWIWSILSNLNLLLFNIIKKEKGVYMIKGYLCSKFKKYKFISLYHFFWGGEEAIYLIKDDCCRLNISCLFLTKMVTLKYCNMWLILSCVIPYNKAAPVYNNVYL